MKLKKQTGILLIAILTSFAMSTNALAKKGGNGQTGNGGGGGGNDSPDPDYAIQANMVDDGCLAYNPDLKGPGIAFGGFYDYIEVSPFTCAAVTTTPKDDASPSYSFYLRTLGLVADENGLVTAVWLRGRNGDNILFDSEETDIVPPIQAPTDGSDFTLSVNTSVTMKKCIKVRGKTSCTDVGDIYVDELVYAIPPDP